MNLPEKVKAVIDRERLIPAGAKVVAAVSGGADSVALLHVLRRLDIPLSVAHLNHGIRSAEADADEQFVKDLCRKLGVECVTARTDVPALAKEQGISLEMAAREARHTFFRTVQPSTFNQPTVIALGHHADDQIETFFLRAARGAGPGGLAGMRLQQQLNGLTLIRPLLGVRRAEIIQWLQDEGLAWREDATNTDETIPRNLIRGRILPLLEKINARAAQNILRTMEILRDEDDFLRGQPKHCSIPSGNEENAAMLRLAPFPNALQRRMVQRWLIELGVPSDFETVERVIEFAAGNEGTRYLDLEGVRLVNEYGHLKAGQAGCLSGQSGRPPRIKTEQGIGILRGAWEASVSLSKIAGREVTVRTPRPGDRMEPYGMEGSRKLQDIFTDQKIPQAQRAHWPVVECGGEIIWIPGYRIARGWELASETAPALHLSCER